MHQILGHGEQAESRGIPVHQALSILPNHERRSARRIHSRRDIYPVVGRGSLVDLADDGFLLGQSASRDARLWIRIGVVPGDVAPGEKRLALGLELIGVRYAGAHFHQPVPDVGVRDARHRRRWLSVNRKKSWLVGLDGEEEILSPYQRRALGLQVSRDAGKQVFERRRLGARGFDDGLHRRRLGTQPKNQKRLQYKCFPHNLLPLSKG